MRKSRSTCRCASRVDVVFVSARIRRSKRKLRWASPMKSSTVSTDLFCAHREPHPGEAEEGHDQVDSVGGGKLVAERPKHVHVSGAVDQERSLSERQKRGLRLDAWKGPVE